MPPRTQEEIDAERLRLAESESFGHDDAAVQSALARMAGDVPDPVEHEVAPSAPPPMRPPSAPESMALAQMQESPLAPPPMSALEAHRVAPYPPGVVAPPVELPTRDHLGNPDPSSGSVFGPDDPTEANAGPMRPMRAGRASPSAMAARRGASQGLADASAYGLDDGRRAEEDAMLHVAREPLPQRPPMPSLARDDAEPMGSVVTQGPYQGQMVAPSGAAESVDQRWARLGIGGDFAPTLPEGDEAEAVHNPAEEAAEGDGKPPMDMEREAAAGPLPRLDEGLPTAERIASARAADPWEHLRRNIANALSVMGGRSGFGAYENQGDALEQQRATGMRTALAGKAASRQTEATQAHQARADAMAQQGLDLRARGVAAQEAMIPVRQASMRANTERTEALTEETRADAAFTQATRAELDSNDSGAADAERAAIAARLALMSPTASRAAAAAIAAQGDLSTMDANELHRIREGLTSGVGIRGAGAGGGGGASLEALRARAIAHGMDPGDAAVLPAADLRREIGEDTGPAARAAHDRATAGEHGVAILPGVYADPEIISSPVAQRSLHEMIVQSTQHLGALERVREIGEEYGRTGFLDPRAEGELVGARSGLMAMVASLENSGIIGPSDMPRILAAVPNPADFTQANLGTLSNRLNSFQQEIDRAARIHLRAAGVTDEGLDAAIRFMHGGGSAPARAPRAGAPAATGGDAPAPSGPVTFRDENGEEYTIADPADIADARAAGWMEVE